MGSALPSRSRKAASVATPLTEWAYEAIKGEILSNRLQPGETLPIQRFTDEMKLSRTPVREAILRLQREGFLEVRPRLGTIVAHLDLRRLREMYQVRSVLESEAAKLACGRIPAGVLTAVDRELRRQRTSGEFDIEAMSNSGQRLHEMVVAHCGNSVLSETIRGLQDHFLRFRHVSLSLPAKVLASHREHLAIVEALKQGEGDEAARLLRDHFDHAARFLIESLLHQPARQPSPVVELRASRRTAAAQP